MNFLAWQILSQARDHFYGTLPTVIPSSYSETAPAEKGAPLSHEMIFRMRHAQKLINAISKIPTKEAFQQRTRGQHIEGRFESSESSWTTDDSIPTVAEALQAGTSLWPFLSYRVTSTLIARQDGKVGWVLRYPKSWGTGMLNDPRMVVGLFMNITIVLILCWLFYKLQLRPLLDLRRGINKFAEGDLNFRIPHTQDSELGDLALAFNDMTRTLQELIESKKQLLTAVSHELRTPITRIRLAIEVEGEKSIPRIERNIKDVERLINDLLESSFLESSNSISQNGPIFLQEIFSELKSSIAAPEGRLKFNAPSNLPPIPGDRAQIMRVIENLIENALKYSNDSQLPVIANVVERPDGLVLQVKDSGPGVPVEFLTRIFEPFFRVDKSRNRKTGGYGFGLHLCQKIVNAHHGTISAENAPEGGLVISVFLPRQTNIPVPTPS